MKEVYRQITAGLSAAFLLVGAVVWTNQVFWFSLIISIMTGVGVYFCIPVKKEDDQIEVAPGITKAQLNTALHLLEIHIEGFIRISETCKKNNMNRKIKDIAVTLEKIRSKFEQDPHDLNFAHQFLNQHLERGLKIVEQYNRLSAMDLNDKNKKALDKAEQIIVRIKAYFTNFYQKCIQDDLLDFEVESETLDAVLDMEFPLADENLT